MSIELICFRAYLCDKHKDFATASVHLSFLTLPLASCN